MSANSNEQTDAMNNFLLLIKTSKSHVKSLSPRQLGGQVIALRNFIESQMSEGRLMIAYSLEMAGVIVSGSKGHFTESRIDSDAELISAFYFVGAESLDAFRERWWKGLRDVEAAHYESTGQPFAAAEPDYRRGFECALGAGQRDRAYDDVVNKLKQRYPDVYNTEAFRRGYERGQARAAGRRSDRAA